MTGRKLLRGVAIVGAGMSKFGAFPEKNSRDLFVEAFKDMSRSVDKGFDPKQIESFFLGNFSSDLFEHLQEWRMPVPVEQLQSGRELWQSHLVYMM